MYLLAVHRSIVFPVYIVFALICVSQGNLKTLIVFNRVDVMYEKSMT